MPNNTNNTNNTNSNALNNAIMETTNALLAAEMELPDLDIFPVDEAQQQQQQGGFKNVSVVCATFLQIADY